MYNLIAHRGIDSSKFGENTKEGVIDALSKEYISGAEFDVRITRDNKIVVIHDLTINRTSDGAGFVSKMTYRNLKKYNFGTEENPSRICLLSDMLSSVNDDKILLIEVKCEVCDEDRFLKYFARTIKNFRDKNIYIMSFNGDIIKKIKKKCSFLRCGVLIGSIINFNYINENFDFIAISSYSTGKVKDYEKPIFIWALNSKKKYCELLEKMNKKTYYIVDFPVNFID